MLCFGLLLMRLIVLDSWLVFLSSVVVYTGVYALFMYMFAMNESEKDLIRVPLRKIFKLMRRK